MTTENTMIAAITEPRGWTAADLKNDGGWAIRLSAGELADFERGLQHARSSGKALYDLLPDDFPFGPAALARLKDCISETQQGRGFQMMRGFPVERWSVEDARLFFWGL